MKLWIELFCQIFHYFFKNNLFVSSHILENPEAFKNSKTLWTWDGADKIDLATRSIWSTPCLHGGTLWFFFKHIFCVKPYHMYQENPEGTQVIVGSMNMGYISDTARNRTHNLFRPQREPIPLGHSDGLMHVSITDHFCLNYLVASNAYLCCNISMESENINSPFITCC